MIEPVKEEAPVAKPKGRPKKQPEEVVVAENATVAEPEVPAFDEFPDEPDFSK